ncbi:hypothetical protein BUALT_Bualt03G0140500 [Buddleja alternifolia]|uniref:Homeobox-leucine zipper protein n=1 Tax=Buddleja alternifolia TaxID=168488 RepID=A0AAV6XV91_9LAMI|nr:hypothetical protein BUALT_Bualt03G0140500 [Buddleja alternifolia]
MTEDMASFIGNSLGQFRSVDLARNGVSGGSTLRIRVGLDVSKPLRRVSFFRAGSNNFNISYTYERLPNFCYICGIMGHIFQFCEAPNKDVFKKSDKEFPFSPSLRAPSRMSYHYRSMRRGSDAFSPHNENPSRSSLATTWRKDSRPHDHQLPVRAQVQKSEGTETHNASHKQPISDCEMEGTSGASPPTYLNSLTVGSLVPMITSPVKIVSPGDSNQRPISPSHELDHTIDALRVHPVIAMSVQSPTGETQAIQVISDRKDTIEAWIRSCHGKLDADQFGLFLTEQVRLLEACFDAGKKLEPEQKFQLARELGVPPRQIAIWYQNKRARWKNQSLEVDHGALQVRLEAALVEKKQLEKEVDNLRGELKRAQNMLFGFRQAQAQAVQACGAPPVSSLSSCCDEGGASSSLNDDVGCSGNWTTNDDVLQFEELYACMMLGANKGSNCGPIPDNERDFWV